MSNSNGHGEIAAAKDLLARSEGGRAVLALLQHSAITMDDVPALAKGIVPFVKERVGDARQAVLEIEMNMRAFIIAQERAMAELVSRMAALEKRFVEFEQKRVNEIEQRAATLELQLAKSLKNVTYEGVFDEQRSYVPGELVTRHGSTWHCDRECPCGVAPDTPEGAKYWTLMVKRGRDGRGSR